MSTESHFNRVVRQGIEKTITEAYMAGDANLMDEQLDKWPGGRPRKEISLEMAHHIAKVGVGEVIELRAA